MVGTQHKGAPNFSCPNVAVCRKRELFRIQKQSENEEDKKKHCEEKKDTKRVVYMAMDKWPSSSRSSGEG